MPMNESDLTEVVQDVHDAIQILTAGCQQLARGIENQTVMLTEILQAVSAQPEGESPLVETLRRLVTATQANGEALHRIERAVTR